MSKAKLDCGDRSCHFAKNKEGMRTNGGCRCFDNAGFGRSLAGSAIKMLPMYLDLQSENDALKKRVEKLERSEVTVVLPQIRGFEEFTIKIQNDTPRIVRIVERE